MDFLCRCVFTYKRIFCKRFNELGLTVLDLCFQIWLENFPKPMTLNNNHVVDIITILLHWEHTLAPNYRCYSRENCIIIL